MNPEGKAEILIVDSDPEIQKYLSENVDSCVFEGVSTIDEGRERVSNRMDRPYDGVIVDTAAPGGLRFAEELRETVENVQVIVHTTDDNGLHEEYLRKLGVTKYLVKPYDSDTNLPRVVEEVAEQIREHPNG